MPATCTGPKLRPRPISFNIIAESAGGIIPVSSRYLFESLLRPPVQCSTVISVLHAVEGVGKDRLPNRLKTDSVN